MLTLIIGWDWDMVGTIATIVAPIITVLFIVFYAGGLKQKVTTNADNIIKLDDKMEKSIERLDQKIDASVERLDQKIDASVERLDQKIDASVERLDQKIDASVERLDKKIEKLDEKIDKNAEKNDDRHATVMEHLGNLSGNIDLIKRALNIKPITDQNSPLNITKEGWEVAKAIKAAEAVDEVWDKILKEIKDENITKDHNPYDIQEACFEIGRRYTDFVSEKRIDVMKTYALMENYHLYEFHSLFGVLIRDRFYKENGIDIKK